MPGDDADELVERLRRLAKTARGHAKDTAEFAEAADHAADVVAWTNQYVRPIQINQPSLAPADYLRGVQRAEEDLSGANWHVSSARSYVETISTGIVTTASGVISQTILTARAGSPVFELRVPDSDAAGRRKRVGAKLDLALPGHGLSARLDGAWQGLNSGGADALAQAAHSMREILTTLLDRLAPVALVREAPWWEEVPETSHGVSKRQKIRYFLVGHGPVDDFRVDTLERLVEEAYRAHDAAVKVAHHSKMGRETAVRNALTALEGVLEQLVDTRALLRASA